MELAYDVYCPTGDREQNLPPVVMMHGMLDSKNTWKYIAPRVANRTGRKVYAIDARNHGDSPWNENMTFDINADDLGNFLLNKNIPKVAVVGHSMGGRTAIGLALKKPEVVEKIVVEDMNLRNFRPNQTGLIVQIIHVMKESLTHIPPGCDERTAKKAIVNYMMSLFPQDKMPKKSGTGSGYDLSMMPPLKRDGPSYSWAANLDVLEEMLTTEKIRQNLGGVYTADALFLYGTKSFFNVDKDTSIKKLFPRATLVGVERATHLVHFEFPDRYVDEVSSFLNDGINEELKSKY